MCVIKLTQGYDDNYFAEKMPKWKAMHGSSIKQQTQTTKYASRNKKDKTL